MAIRAVLFDVGGPIDTEVTHEAVVDAYLQRALLAVGAEAGRAALDEASEWAVQSFAPDAYAAIIWRLCNGEAGRAREAQRLFYREWAEERASARKGVDPRPGIDAVIRSLHERGYLLGLAANQPQRVVAELDAVGLGECFSHREVTGHHGFRKPDVRLFLRACQNLGVAPEETIMVGDRVDNDIFPAKARGMKAVLFRTGRHQHQQPRSLDEVPDAEVRTVEELSLALKQLLAQG
jgi:putative hydrolase of the HAD superfamily